MRSCALWSRLSSRAFLFLDVFILPSILNSLHVPAAEKPPHSMRCPLLVTVLVRWWAVPGVRQTQYLKFCPKKSGLLFCPENSCIYSLRDIQMPFGKHKEGCHVSFTQEWLLSVPWRTSPEDLTEGECWDLSPHLQRGLLRLSEWQLCLGYPPDQSPSCSVSIVRWPRSAVGSKRLPFHNYWGHCPLGNSQSFRNVYTIALIYALPHFYHGGL